MLKNILPAKTVVVIDTASIIGAASRIHVEGEEDIVVFSTVRESVHVYVDVI